MLAKALIALLLVAPGPVLAAAPEESIAPLLDQAMPGSAHKRFTAVVVTFPPGARAVPHRHGSAFLYAYVLEGIVRSQLEGEGVKSFGVGDSWTEPPGAHHLLTENASAAAPARLLVTFVSEDGEPLKIPDGR